MIFEGKTIEAAIFDMDGTMFDTERLRFRMLQTASKLLFGKEMSEQLLMDSLGLSAVSAEALAKKVYGDTFPYKAIRKKADELEIEYVRTNGVPVKPRLLNVLERLKKNDVFIALATSSRRVIAEEYLMNVKIMRFFDVLVCGDEVKKGKPDPEIFRKAANELNCDPSVCLIFEDSSNGLLAAAAAGGNPVYIKDIKDPVPEIKKSAFRAYDSMEDMLTDLVKCTPVLPLPEIDDPFPQSIDTFSVGIHGFGAIGGGYFAQIFSHWDGYTRPNQIIGATRNPVIRQLVNGFGAYSVRYSSLGYFQPVDRVHIIDINDKKEMEQMYIESEIIGLALPEQAIAAQAPMIADCLTARYRVHDKKLVILVSLNKLNGAKYVKKLLQKALKKKVDDDTARYILNKVTVCETVVNRMVSSIPEEEVLKQVQTRLINVQEDLSVMESDINALTGPDSIFTSVKKFRESVESNPSGFYSTLKNFSSILTYAKVLSELRVTLFNSEPDMALYAGCDEPLLQQLRQITVVDNITRLQEIKNKLSNGTHAILAWYASLLGYKSIGQGMGDERVFTFVWEMMHTEIKTPLISENPDLASYINGFVTNFIKRCRVSFKDPTKRVARDPLRKLQEGERIFGTMRLAQSRGMRTPYLEFGAACGLLYAVRLINPDDKECVLIHELYKKNGNIREVLTWNGTYNGAPYKGLDPVKDEELISRIAKQFSLLDEQILQN